METSLNRLDGNLELYRSLLFKFKMKHENTILELKLSIENTDLETGRRLAHTLKTTSGNIGAVKLQLEAAQMEQAFKNNHISEISSLFPSLEKNILKTAAEIQEILPDVPGEKDEKKETGTTEQFHSFLKELSPLVKKRTPKQCRDIIITMNTYQWPEIIQKNLVELDSLVQHYKFREAGDLIIRIQREREEIFHA